MSVVGLMVAGTVLYLVWDDNESAGRKAATVLLVAATYLAWLAAK